MLRVIGGGNDVALQDLYVRRNKGRSKSSQLLVGPAGTEGVEDKKRTTSEWVNSVLKRNLPKTEAGIVRGGVNSDRRDESDDFKMCLKSRNHQPHSQLSSRQTAFTRRTFVGRSVVSKLCLLV